MRGLRNLAVAALVWAGGCILSAAAETAEDFHAAVAAAYAPYREAVHYLETGNAGLAGLAIERAQDEWRKVEATYAPAPPDAFAKDPKWSESLALVGRAFTDGLKAAESGNAEAALAALATVRRSLADLRLRSGQRVYSDCIDAMNAAMDLLYAYRRKPPARTVPAEQAAFAKAVADTETWYRRCRDEAPPAMREAGEFKRLFEGALVSLGRLKQAGATGPDDLIVSLVRELRSFDKLIWLRFG
jgi:hypothetical protein